MEQPTKNPTFVPSALAAYLEPDYLPNKKFAESSSNFKAVCAVLGIPATPTQAGKWRRKCGAAWRFWDEVCAQKVANLQKLTTEAGTRLALAKRSLGITQGGSK